MANYIQGEGPLGAKLWIIGDAPGTKELEMGKPLVGWNGKFLFSLLREHGLTRSDVRIENLMEEKPQGGKFQWFHDNKAEDLSLRVAALKEKLRMYQPNCVLLLGEEPLQQIAGETNISKWRGSILWSEVCQVKCVATYHPSACLRELRNPDGGAYAALASFDIKRAIEEATFPEYNIPTPRLILEPTLEQVRWARDELLKADSFAFDIETQGLYVTCISFAGYDDWAISIPLCRVLLDGVGAYWTQENEIAVFRIIRELLQSDVPKELQNALFDATILKAIYKTECVNIYHDTLTANHNIYAELPKDLGTLGSIWTRSPYHKNLGHTTDNYQYWKYNALDSWLTHQIAIAQVKEMKKLDIYWHYLWVTVGMIPCLVDMQIEGVLVDTDLRQRAWEECKEYQNEIADALSKGLGIDINLNSPKQVGELLYDVLGLPARRKGKGRTTEESYISKFITPGDPYHSKVHPLVRDIIRAILQYKRQTKMMGTLSTPLGDDNRMRCAYNVKGKGDANSNDGGGAKTGRLRSSKSIFGTGTNLQNQAPGPQRACITPDPGNVFLLPDLKSAESYVVAIEGAEENLLELLKSGDKPHFWLCRNIWPDDTITSDDPRYGMAKQCFHAVSYGGDARTINTHTGRSLLEAKRWVTAITDTFPGIARRNIETKQRVQRTRELRSLLGRRMLYLGIVDDKMMEEAFAWRSQSCVGELTNIAMTRVYFWGRFGKVPIFPSINTHDGLVVQCPEESMKIGVDLVEKAFATPLRKDGYEITVPIDIAWGRNFDEKRKL